MEKVNFLEQAYKIYDENTKTDIEKATPTVDHIIVLVEEINQLKKRVFDLEMHMKEKTDSL